jgi:uncharacterized membrane protein
VLEVAEKDADLAMKCGVKGLDAWYCASHPEDWDDDDECFSREDVDSFYDLGYAEPAEILLKKYGVEYTLLDPEYDENDEVICDDYIID